MLFTETSIAGAHIIDIEPIHDERGFFSRLFCVDEFAAHGLVSEYVQSSISFNKWKGTLRGMHFQRLPHQEVKLVRCTRGSIYDVIVDLRRESSTFRQWVAVELSAENRRALYIPVGLAHGFQTLEDNSEVLYQMSEFYHPESASGVRWDDPAFGIQWPCEEKIMSERDVRFRDFVLEDAP